MHHGKRPAQRRRHRPAGGQSQRRNGCEEVVPILNRMQIKTGGSSRPFDEPEKYKPQPMLASPLASTKGKTVSLEENLPPPSSKPASEDAGTGNDFRPPPLCRFLRLTTSVDPLACSTPKAREPQAMQPVGVAFCLRCPLFGGQHDSSPNCTCQYFKRLVEAKRSDN